MPDARNRSPVSLRDSAKSKPLAAAGVLSRPGGRETRWTDSGLRAVGEGTFRVAVAL